MTTPLILIPNLAIGNFASVLRMIYKVGGRAVLSDEPAALASADKLILAGVGAFDPGVQSIREKGWSDALHEHAIVRKKPALGICLGAQMMCAASEEGQQPGLGWLAAHVRRFHPPAGSALKIPHMGWRSVRVVRENPLLSPEDAEQRFYFVHSYYITCDDERDVVATAEYGQEFVAAFAHENVFGVQFHPEKSHRFGMSVIRHFAEL